MGQPNAGSTVPSASAGNIRAISDLEYSALAKRSAGERWADKVASTAGKVWFTVGHFFWFAGWIILNLGVVGSFTPFDPYPFPLLTLATSLEAIFLSLFILTSQSRATAQAEQRSQLDLQINLLAESESTVTLKMLQALCEHHGLKIAHDPEVEQLAQRTEPKTLVRDLQSQLPDAP
jgi:uncharacterized membrane protein